MKILTVRFTYREHLIRIIGAGYWRRGKKAYEETINEIETINTNKDGVCGPDGCEI